MLLEEIGHITVINLQLEVTHHEVCAVCTECATNDTG